MTLRNLNDLLQDQLQSLHSAETQLVESLPSMIENANCNRLKASLQDHLVETQTHVQRLERIADQMNFNPKGKTCTAMKGMIAEGTESLDESAPNAIHDASLIAAAQRVQHCKISRYGTAREFAEALGLSDVAQVLQESLDEERDADVELTEVCRDLFETAPMHDADTRDAPDNVKKDENRDPITGEHGAHPVGTGLGAAAGGAAAGAATGAAVGLVAGPVGTFVGAAIGATAGAVAGGLAGKAIGEAVNPTVEHDYWRSQFHDRRYVSSNDNYDTYAPAYQYGWESRAKYQGKEFSEVERDMETGWTSARGSSKLPWANARHAARDSWEHATTEHS